ncbi:hypothetical protein [Paenibacillus sp. N3.4]|uniref:hypothetical protein n=1 Tax=Paenibacillus sp. N3.4 TaxID=2603222 RepID=UPI0011C71582|nr:hypothetical protein [Paenibacillus sp. N3.4]TXK85971.1 hypothetical protein FU659_00490 [Paenibacillus sp. N3.4]
MLQTKQIEICMHMFDKKVVLKLNDSDKGSTLITQLDHAELIELIHTLLEINRSFRGDIPFYLPKKNTLNPTN